MDPLLTHLITQFGVFLRREAIGLGYDDRTFDRFAADHCHHVRHGAYTSKEAWGGLTDGGRHTLRAKAAYRTSRTDVAISHISSVLHQTETWWDLPLTDVHLTRLDGRGGRREAGRCVHRGQTRPDDLEVVGGYLRTTATRCGVEIATLADFERAIVVLDGLLRSGRTTTEQLLERYFDGMDRDPGSLSTPAVLRFADGRAESVGESRCRCMFRALGFPIPELQKSVFTSFGKLLGTTDFWWPERDKYGEFDGRIKYGRLLKPGQTPGDAVVAEKRREDAIREETGRPFIRFTWWDLEHPEATRPRLEKFLAAPRARVFIV